MYLPGRFGLLLVVEADFVRWLGVVGSAWPVDAGVIAEVVVESSVITTFGVVGATVVVVVVVVVVASVVGLIGSVVFSA